MSAMDREMWDHHYRCRVVMIKSGEWVTDMLIGGSGGRSSATADRSLPRRAGLDVPIPVAVDPNDEMLERDGLPPRLRGATAAEFMAINERIRREQLGRQLVRALSRTASLPGAMNDIPLAARLAVMAIR